MTWPTKRQQMLSLYGLAYLLIGIDLSISPTGVAVSESYKYLFLYVPPARWGMGFTIVGVISLLCGLVKPLCRYTSVEFSQETVHILMAIASGGIAGLAAGWAFGLFVAFLNGTLHNGPGLVMWTAFSLSTIIFASMNEHPE